MENYELDTFHDIIYNSTGKSLSNSDLNEIIKVMPRHIYSIGLRWGFADTEFRDMVYEWAKENLING